MKKNKAFTLIELISVLVILAILALIVTPLVMNIIKKAKDASNKRSVDAYGRSVEIAIANHLLETGAFPTDLSTLNVEYTGSSVVCNVMQMKENGGLYLSECTVNNKEIKDSSTDDGWYHYGTRDLTNEEYVDMYGDALKTASLVYYTANNQAVSDYTTLTIDYKGKPVSCDVYINEDGTVYLTNCSVSGITVIDDTEDGFYHYGERISYPAYSIGDELTYNNVDYYVIENSDETKSTVNLLKKTPLTVSEVNQYGVGHINNYTIESQGSTYNENGYGSIAYYSSPDCSSVGGGWIYDGCKTNYDESDIKYVVDGWANGNINSEYLVNARLINQDDLDNLKYDVENSVSFMSTESYRFWTMIQVQSDSRDKILAMKGLNSYYFTSQLPQDNRYYPCQYCSKEYILVRPVISLSKAALSD